MLRLVHDAEDIIQDSYLRAWRSYDEFENRSPLRTWLYQVATNTCLTALRHRPDACGPSRLCGPTDDPHTEPIPAGPEVAWLQPIPGGAAVVKSTLQRARGTRTSERGITMTASTRFLIVGAGGRVGAT